MLSRQELAQERISGVDCWLQVHFQALVQQMSGELQDLSVLVSE